MADDRCILDDVPGQVKVLLRLAPELHAALKEIASREDRSLNAQITRVLRTWVAEQQGPPGTGEHPTP